MVYVTDQIMPSLFEAAAWAETSSIQYLIFYLIPQGIRFSVLFYVVSICVFYLCHATSVGTRNLTTWVRTLLRFCA